MNTAAPESADDLEAWLDGRMSNAKPPSLERTLATLREAAGRPWLMRVLRHLLDDAQWLSRMAAQSYAHPNGFDKLVLIHSPTLGYKLRLHLWSQGAAAAEHIHDHRWQFAATVLDGALDVAFFDLATRGPLMHRYSYSPMGYHNRFRLSYIDRARVRRFFATRLTAGTDYALGASVLHRVVVCSNHPTATLILQAPPEKETTTVLSEIPVAGPSETAPPPMSESRFDARLRGYFRDPR